MTSIHVRNGFRALSCAAAALAALSASLPAAAQSDFQGKTIRFVIASTPSGPTDMAARVFAPHIATHIPGKPNIVFENRPGAVGVIAANYMFNLAKPDGLTVGVLLGMVTSGLMRIDGVQYQPSKLRMVGAISATQVLLARKDLAFKSPSDLLKPAKPLVLASLGTGSTTDAANRLFLDMIGTNYRYVTGYPGQAETILALSRDEANIANASHATYLTRRDSIRQEGLYDAFLQRGELKSDGTFKRNAQLPEYPTMVEVIEQLKPEALKSADFAAYRSVVGSMAVHYSFVLPPGTPVETVNVLRKAMSDALNAPETHRSVQEMVKSDYDFVSGSDGEAIVQDLEKDYNADPRIGVRLKEIMSVK
jgi:tripartite-type tricarboxylate transporter receptor subunit TctC